MLKLIFCPWLVIRDLRREAAELRAENEYDLGQTILMAREITQLRARLAPFIAKRDQPRVGGKFVKKVDA